MSTRINLSAALIYIAAELIARHTDLVTTLSNLA